MGKSLYEHKKANLDSQDTPRLIAHNGQVQQREASVMNKIYASYFEFGNTPGRGTIQVVDLPNKPHIVFSCIAGTDLSKQKPISVRNMKLSDSKPVIIYSDTYYMSGKSGFIPDQGIVTQDIGLQLRQTMRNLLDDPQGADMDFPEVVQETLYLREMKYTDQVLPLYGTLQRLFPRTNSLTKQLRYEDFEWRTDLIHCGEATEALICTGDSSVESNAFIEGFKNCEIAFETKQLLSI